jgi:F0F1-type ATP synthase membrane subunit b/b'
MSSKSKLFVLVLLFTTAALLASEGEEAHGFDWSAFLGKVLNSTILFGGLIILLRKPMIKFFSQKGLDIKSEMVQREEDIKNTSAQFEKIRRRLDQIEEEILSMRQQAQKSGQEEMQRLEELGQQEADRILQNTEAEINNRLESALKRMKARIAELAIDHFKEDIQSRLDDRAHHKIIEKNIEISGDIIEHH